MLHGLHLAGIDFYLKRISGFPHQLAAFRLLELSDGGLIPRQPKGSYIGYYPASACFDFQISGHLKKFHSFRFAFAEIFHNLPDQVGTFDGVLSMH
jgi:hypothetical protein